MNLTTKSSWPWRLAKSVEEVQDISRQLGVVFNHVQREDNVMANGLAKERVFYLLFLFMSGLF